MRSGASRKPSAPWSSVSALERALWSAARRRRCRARSSAADRVTVSCRARLAPSLRARRRRPGRSRRVRSQRRQQVEVGRAPRAPGPGGAPRPRRRRRPAARTSARNSGPAQVLHLLGHEAPVARPPGPGARWKICTDASSGSSATPITSKSSGRSDTICWDFGRLLRRGDAVAQPGRPLELEVLRRRLHLAPPAGPAPARCPREEPHEVVDVAVVGGVVDRADARPRAALDVVEQAGPAQPLVADELVVRTRADREAAHQQVEGGADGRRRGRRGRSSARPCACGPAPRPGGATRRPG